MKENDFKQEEQITCEGCGNDTFRVYCNNYAWDVTIFCNSCGKNHND